MLKSGIFVLKHLFINIRLIAGCNSILLVGQTEHADVHSSLHHQGAYVCIQAGLQQVHRSIGQHHSATPAAHLTEQDDGGQRELLYNKNTEVNE